MRDHGCRRGGRRRCRRRVEHNRLGVGVKAVRLMLLLLLRVKRTRTRLRRWRRGAGVRVVVVVASRRTYRIGDGRCGDGRGEDGIAGLLLLWLKTVLLLVLILATNRIRLVIGEPVVGISGGCGVFIVAVVVAGAAGAAIEVQVELRRRRVDT